MTEVVEVECGHYFEDDQRMDELEIASPEIQTFPVEGIVFEPTHGFQVCECRVHRRLFECQTMTRDSKKKGKLTILQIWWDLFLASFSSILLSFLMTHLRCLDSVLATRTIVAKVRHKFFCDAGSDFADWAVCCVTTTMAAIFDVVLKYDVVCVLDRCLWTVGFGGLGPTIGHLIGEGKVVDTGYATVTEAIEMGGIQDPLVVFADIVVPSTLLGTSARLAHEVSRRIDISKALMGHDCIETFLTRHVFVRIAAFAIGQNDGVYHLA